MLAYSVVAQAGYLLMGSWSATALGRRAPVFYLAAYRLMTLAAFAVMIIRERETRRATRHRPRSPVVAARGRCSRGADALHAVARRLPGSRRLRRQVLPLEARSTAATPGSACSSSVASMVDPRLLPARRHRRLDEPAGAAAGGDPDGERFPARAGLGRAGGRPRARRAAVRRRGLRGADARRRHRAAAAVPPGPRCGAASSACSSSWVSPRRTAGSASSGSTRTRCRGSSTAGPAP